MENAYKGTTVINDLPHEMLVKIFEVMDSETLKNAALVCKRFVHCLLYFSLLSEVLLSQTCRWNETIGQSSSVMEKLPLALEGSWFRISQALKNFTRKYHTVNIDESVGWTESTIKVLQKHGYGARLLQLNDCNVESKQVKTFIEMLKIFKSLEVLKISSSCLENFNVDSEKFKTINLPCLKTVVLDQSSLNVSRIELLLEASLS
jgi:F-box-like